MTSPQLLPLGPDGILVRFSLTLDDAANRDALRFRVMVDDAGLEGVSETATSLTSVYIRFRPDQTTRAEVEAALHRLMSTAGWRDRSPTANRTLWHIPAAFGEADGPGLEDAATLAGIDPDQAIREVTAHPLRVLALGFAPGQPYLGFLPEHWDIPRQADLTPKVPQGAIVVAVRQVIPFANAAPTGWRQIGRTAFRCYTPSVEPALPLRPGDEVRFQQIDANQLQKLAGDPRGGADVEVLS